MPILPIINTAAIADKNALEQCNNIIFVHSIKDDDRNPLLFPLNLRCVLNLFDYYKNTAFGETNRIKINLITIRGDKIKQIIY